jgi:predicted 3-demethylubiquinone-9 3-methyltransferase (glyoxalase superfamily)
MFVLTKTSYMQKITTFLLYNGQAEEAMHYYTSIFKDSKVESVTRYGKNMPLPEGTVLTASFTLAGHHFVALNGYAAPFTEAISFSIDCADQAEVDYYWEKLTANGGQEGPCGWLKDKFGMSWQVVPRILPEVLGGADKEKAGRAMQAMMQMKKIIVKDIEEA